MKAIASFVRLSTWVATVLVVALPVVARAEVSAASAEAPPLAAAPPPSTASASSATTPSATQSATPAQSASPAQSATAAPPSEPAPAGATTPAIEPLPANIDGATYRVRLRDLEQRVDELKEKIRQSHTRLSLLSDTVLSGAAGGARAEVVLENDLSGAWKLVEAVVVLDGAVQYKKTDDTGVLSEQKRIPIFTGSIPSGDHVVQVMLKLRGHGFGVFSYLKGIEATVRNDYSFTVSDGKLIELRAIAWEQGGPTTPVEEQPTIRFVENVRAMGDVPRSSNATPLSSAPAKPAGPAPQSSSALQSSPSGSAPKPAEPSVAGKSELKDGAAGAKVQSGAGTPPPSAP